MKKLIENLVDSSCMIGTALVIRWIYGISTPEKDYTEVRKFAYSIKSYIILLKWYRFFEWKRQYEARRIIDREDEHSTSKH